MNVKFKQRETQQPFAFKRKTGCKAAIQTSVYTVINSRQHQGRALEDGKNGENWL